MIWSVRQVVKPLPSHGGVKGSSPLPTTSQNGKVIISKNLSDEVYFTKSAPSQTLNYERAYMTRGRAVGSSRVS